MSAADADDRSEIGRDDLDAQVGTADLRAVRLIDLLGRTRAALGLRRLSAPALVCVPLGAIIGPAGLGWVPQTTLGHLYPVIAVGLAAIGIFVGFGVALARRDDRRLLVIASLEALITIVVVAAACAWLFASWDLGTASRTALLAIVLGVCASASSASIGEPGESPRRHAAMRIAELDDVLPILVGGIILSFSTGADVAAALTLVALGLAVPVAVALAGWLLFERAHDDAERYVFVIGVVALLGGVAAYLGVSPLLAGMVAGVFWKYSPGRSDAVIRGDLRRIQRPLVVLLLIFAGAAAEMSYLALWLSGAYVMTRLCAKLLGGWIASRATPTLSPADLGSYLLPPGMMGLGFALSFHLVTFSVTSAAVLTAVALGTLASELIAAVALLGPRGAA
ncbi:MAG: cation:proton antiporter [Vicinamibacterales bacterium]